MREKITGVTRVDDRVFLHRRKFYVLPDLFSEIRYFKLPTLVFPQLNIYQFNDRNARQKIIIAIKKGLKCSTYISSSIIIDVFEVFAGRVLWVGYLKISSGVYLVNAKLMFSILLRIQSNGDQEILRIAVLIETPADISLACCRAYPLWPPVCSRCNEQPPAAAIKL